MLLHFVSANQALLINKIQERKSKTAKMQTYHLFSQTIYKQKCKPNICIK